MLAKPATIPTSNGIHVYRNLSHRAERDHHDLTEEQEEQDETHSSDISQDGQIETISGLRWRHRNADISQFQSALLHRGCAVVQAHSEDRVVLRVALECSLEHVETHQESSRPRLKAGRDALTMSPPRPTVRR